MNAIGALAPGDAVRAVAPVDLGPARIAAHHAARWLTRAARAALPAKADDSHTNLGWDRDFGGFVSNPLDGEARGFALGLRLADLTIMALAAGSPVGSLPLDGRSDEEVGVWVADTLGRAGVQAGGIDEKLPYDLDDPLPGGAYGVAGIEPQLAALAGWYGLADAALQALAAGQRDVEPGPSPVRCWPHHFDIATLVGLEGGDPETARSIGVGFSPGDGSFAQPYAYIAPWPPPAQDSLPPLDLGHWHTEGFVAAVLTGDAALAEADPAVALSEFTENGFAEARRALGS